jgi:hypothetical protein
MNLMEFMNEIISINYCFPIHNIVLMGVGENNLSALALRGFQERNYCVKPGRSLCIR